MAGLGAGDGPRHHHRVRQRGNGLVMQACDGGTTSSGHIMRKSVVWVELCVRSCARLQL